ncbi:polyhydroxyalkanoic acid system family protein [Haliea sp. E17]|uniref:polyhydroxyalkanoic acid system family protein n=1 Tax=Haliea sp. E17 TaxID=3401576 RepID=UPI003AB037EC
MAGFRITKHYTMPREEVRAAAEGFAADLEREYGVRSKWSGDRVRIKGSGVDGELSFDDGLIDISVKLGLLASMFEGKLKKEVQRYLDEYIS